VLLDQFATAGWLVVFVHTTLVVPQDWARPTKFPAPILDVEDAVNYLISNHMGDVTRMSIAGNSSGSQLAMLAAYTRFGLFGSTAPCHSAPQPTFRAVVALSPAVDLYTMAQFNSEIDQIVVDELGYDPLASPANKAGALAASPVSHITARIPPTLVISGDLDKTFTPQASEFATIASGAGATFALHQLPGLMHDLALQTQPNGGVAGALMFAWLEQYGK
jgi:acetyl esterase/lipase